MRLHRLISCSIVHIEKLSLVGKIWAEFNGGAGFHSGAGRWRNRRRAGGGRSIGEAIDFYGPGVAQIAATADGVITAFSKKRLGQRTAELTKAAGAIGCLTGVLWRGGS